MRSLRAQRFRRATAGHGTVSRQRQVVDPLGATRLGVPDDLSVDQHQHAVGDSRRVGVVGTYH